MKLMARSLAIAVLASLAVPGFSQNTGQALSLVSGGRSYAPYLSAGSTPGRKPGIVLTHSFKGLEQGYMDLVDKFAADGFVVLAVGWQTFEKSPGDEIARLQHPLLMIHGSADQASPIAGIYQYAAALQGADKYFELKVYQGLPHGFMVQNGKLWKTETAEDACQQTVGFFKRKL